MSKSKRRVKKNAKQKKRAFTLIELLAVIIILGVIMLIAIPSVTRYVSDSRKSTYVATAKRYIQGARNIVNDMESGMYDLNTTYYIPISCVKLESGGQSPYGDFTDAYVIVSYNGNGYDYYWASTDTAKMGINIANEKDLNEKLVKSNVETVDIAISVAPDSSVTVMDSESCTFEPTQNASSSFLSADKDVSNEYNVEFVPFYYDFSGRETYTREPNGTKTRLDMMAIYNSPGFWGTMVNREVFIFQIVNDSDYVKHGQIDLEIPKFTNKKTGQQARVTNWYFEMNIEGYSKENWTCYGTADEKHVTCQPKERYVANIIQPDTNVRNKATYYLYYYLDDGNHIRVKTGTNSYSFYYTATADYMFPHSLTYGAVIPN